MRAIDDVDAVADGRGRELEGGGLAGGRRRRGRGRGRALGRRGGRRRRSRGRGGRGHGADVVVGEREAGGRGRAPTPAPSGGLAGSVAHPHTLAPRRARRNPSARGARPLAAPPRRRASSRRGLTSGLGRRRVLRPQPTESAPSWIRPACPRSALPRNSSSCAPASNANTNTNTSTNTNSHNDRDSGPVARPTPSVFNACASTASQLAQANPVMPTMPVAPRTSWVAAAAPGTPVGPGPESCAASQFPTRALRPPPSPAPAPTARRTWSPL